MDVGVICAEKSGWVGRKSAFFEFFLREVSTTPTPGSPHIPQRWRPQPQHTRTACTSQAAWQTVQGMAHRPGRWTRCTGLHSILDRPRGAIWTAAGAGGRAVCPKLSRFGHSVAAQKNISFLNTFVARATENPFTVSQKCDIIMSQK